MSPVLPARSAAGSSVPPAPPTAPPTAPRTPILLALAVALPWTGLSACQPSAEPVDAVGARPSVVESAPAAARLQAARAAPLSGPSWAGPWTIEVGSMGPVTAEVRALADHLGVVLASWPTGRPAAGPGEAAAVWIAAGADLDAVSDALRPAGGAQAGGAVVAVLGPGTTDWRTDAAARLPWAGVELLDPAAEAERYGLLELGVDAGPRPAAAAPAPGGGAGDDGAGEGAGSADELRATLAARVLGERFDLPWRPLAEVADPRVATIVGEADAAWLDDPDPRVRAEAVRRLQPVGGTGRADEDVAVRLALAALSGARLLRDPDPQVRARAIDSLGVGDAGGGSAGGDVGGGDVDGVPVDHRVAALVAALEDGSSVVRVMAAHHLARLAFEGAPVAEALRAAADSPDAYVRWKAAWGLTAVPDAGPLLERMLDDRDADVRRQAARSLGHRRDPAAVPALVAALSDENSFVRRWAAEALGEIGDRGARPALTRASRDPTLLVAAAASRSLAALGEPLAAPPPYAPPPPPRDAAAVHALATDRDATRRKDLCKFLAGQPAWRDVLATLLRDDDSEVRKTAAEALGWDPGATALLEGAVGDEDPDVVVTALIGLRRQRAGARDAVRARLAEPDAEIRLRAVQALAATPGLDAGDRARLAARAGAGDERERAAVVAALPDLLAPGESAVLVLRAAAAAGGPVRGGVLVEAAAPGAEASLAAWARGVIAREDDLLHERFSWNDPADRPEVYGGLRPPVIRPYGDPDRG